MDYEHKIRQLEEETRHYRALQTLHSERINAHGLSISAIDQRLDRITLLQEQNASAITEFQAGQRELQTGLRDLEGIVRTLAKTVDELVRALTAGRTNGKP